MTMSQAQRKANRRAHRSLAETRRIARYLRALQDREEFLAAVAVLDDELLTLQQEFIETAKSFSERKGYTYEDWIALGIAPAVLKKAGIHA